jgi:hypothetical protein
MPTGVTAETVRLGIETTLLVEGEDMRTMRPLWEINVRARVRVCDEFVGRHVEVDVWPDRKEGDTRNHTVRYGRVRSSAWNSPWGPKGTAVLVLEFPEGMTKKDLPIPMSTVYAVRTVAPPTEEDDDGTRGSAEEPAVLPDPVHEPHQV